MKKIILPDLEFKEILILLGDVSKYWWVVDIQSGPFDSSWFFKSQENEIRHNEAFVDFEGMGNSSTYLLKPGTFPELAEYLIIDEWSYIATFQAHNENIAKEHFNKYYFQYKGDFIESFKQGSEFLLIYPDGWWEFYTKNFQLEEKIKKAEQKRVS